MNYVQIQFLIAIRIWNGFYFPNDIRNTRSGWARVTMSVCLIRQWHASMIYMTYGYYATVVIRGNGAVYRKCRLIIKAMLYLKIWGRLYYVYIQISKTNEKSENVTTSLQNWTNGSNHNIIFCLDYIPFSDRAFLQGNRILTAGIEFRW